MIYFLIGLPYTIYYVYQFYDEWKTNGSFDNRLNDEGFMMNVALSVSSFISQFLDPMKYNVGLMFLLNGALVGGLYYEMT